MSKRRVLVLMLLLLSSAAFADSFVGQASVIDGDTLEIHGTRIRLWGVDAPESTQLCRGEDSLQYRCGSKAANDLDAYIARRPVNCVPLSLDRTAHGRDLFSRGGGSRGMACAQWSRARLAPIFEGHIAKLSARLSARARDSGRAATSSRGSIVHASAQAESRPTVRTMQMPILDAIQCEASIHNVRWPIIALG